MPSMITLISLGRNCGSLVFGILGLIWKPLLALTVGSEIALAEGMHPECVWLAFMLLMAAAIAIAMKIVDILLITSLLIIPAAMARSFSNGPERVAILASCFGVAAVVLGLFGSLEFDTPAGPSVVVALLLFIATFGMLAFRRVRRDYCSQG